MPSWIIIDGLYSFDVPQGTILGSLLFLIWRTIDFLECATDIIINIVVWQASTNNVLLGLFFIFLASLILLCAYECEMIFFFSDLGILWNY